MQDLSLFVRRMGSIKNFQLKTPQQNGVVERKNRVIQEMAIVVLLNKQIPQKFWRVSVTLAIEYSSERDTYEIWNGKKPKVKYFRVFGSKCYILNDRENLGKFNAKSNEGMPPLL